jgi:hypothetical protein
LWLVATDVGQRGPLQRPRPLRRGPGRGRAGRRGAARARHPDVAAGRPDRGGGPGRQAGARSRPARALAEIAEANGIDWSLGLLARSRAVGRGRGGREALPRGARASRPHPHPRRARPHAAGLRRVAAPRDPPRRRPRAAPRRTRDALRHRHGGLCRARPARAAGHRDTVRKRTVGTINRTYTAGAADRAACGGRADEAGDRRAAVLEPAHRRVAPAQGVRQARDQLAQGAAFLAARGRRDHLDSVGGPRRLAGPSLSLSGAGGAGSRALRPTREPRPHRETTTPYASFM